MKRHTDTTLDRVYDPKQHLSTEIVKAVLQRFRYDIPALLGNNLAFACIVGGFAKGYAVNDQDIDMFICVKTLNDAIKKDFQDYYFKIHEEFDLVPDRDKPGEIMTIGRLQQKLALVNQRPLRKTIESYYEYEGLSWADMISGPKVSIVGDFEIFSQVMEACETIPQKWRKEVYEIMGDDLELETAKLPIQRLIKFARRKGYITYQKNDKKQNQFGDAYKKSQ